MPTTNVSKQSKENASPALSCIMREKDRRKETRRDPRPGKTVTVYISTTVDVVDESSGGICLKLPTETNLDIGEPVAIRDDGFNRVGRVCWTSLKGGHRIVGFSWIDSETPTTKSLDAEISRLISEKKDDAPDGDQET